MSHFIKLPLLGLLLLVFGLIACDEKNTDIDLSNLHFSGNVYFENGLPVQDMVIGLNEGYWTSTDSNGYFRLEGLPAGNYTFKAEKLNFHNYSFIRASDSINLTTGHVDDFILQIPQQPMLQLQEEASLSEISLRWNKASREHFEKYEIYGHVPYNDELTAPNGEGLFIYNMNDTSITIDSDMMKIYPNGNIPFRLHVFYDNGIEVTSGLLRVETPEWDRSAFNTSYQLKKVKECAITEKVTGLDWDADGNLWLSINCYCGQNGILATQLINYNWQENAFTDTIQLDVIINGVLTVFNDSLWTVQNGDIFGFNPAYPENKKIVFNNEFRYYSDLSKVYHQFYYLFSNHTIQYIGTPYEIVSIPLPFEAYGYYSYDLGFDVVNWNFWVINSLYEIAVVDFNGKVIDIIETDLFRPIKYYGLKEKSSSLAINQRVPEEPRNAKIAVNENYVAIAHNNGVTIYTY